MQKAIYLETSGEWSEASRYYRKLLSSELSDNTRADASLRLAACLLETCKRGQVDEAEECLADAQRAIAKLGDSVLLGRLRIQQGRLDEQQGNLRRALDRYVTARQLLTDDMVELSKARPHAGLCRT